MKKFIVISGECMGNEGKCKRVPVSAVAFNGGFITHCPEHENKPVVLNAKAMDKIIVAMDMTKHVKTMVRFGKAVDTAIKNRP